MVSPADFDRKIFRQSTGLEFESAEIVAIAPHLLPDARRRIHAHPNWRRRLPQERIEGKDKEITTREGKRAILNSCRSRRLEKFCDIKSPAPALWLDGGESTSRRSIIGRGGALGVKEIIVGMSTVAGSTARPGDGCRTAPSSMNSRRLGVAR